MRSFSISSNLSVFAVFLLLLPTALSEILLPQASGPYGTRITTAKLVDQSRLDPYAPNRTHRAIMVTAFYPIINSSDCEPLQILSYMPLATAQFWDPVFATYNITNATLEDVGVSACRQNSSVGPLCHGKDQPIVIVSGGLGASRQMYSGMAQSVASHGYLVVTIDHPYDAYVVEYPDGTLVYAANITTEAQEDFDVTVRAQDVSFLLDQLSANATLQRVIPGANCGLNVSKVAMFGHSLGGATAAAAMLNDTRITGGLNMDGDFHGPVIQRGLDRPFLIFDTLNHTRLTSSNLAETWSHLRGWKLDLTFAKVEHYAFSDLSLLTKLFGWSPFTSTAYDPGAILGTLDGKRGFDVITAYVVAFMDFVLKGVESEILQAPSPLYPEILPEPSRTASGVTGATTIDEITLQSRSFLQRVVDEMTSSSAIAVTRLPRKANASHPSHHVGSPPTSFNNPWPSFHKQSLLELLVTSQRNRDFKPVPSRERLVPVQKPDWGTGKGGLKATWIGHASFLVETSTSEGAERGVRVLFDPVFSERTSPVTWAGPKRYNPTPCTIDELPDVDLVVISHDHYDHMDSDTLLKIYKRRKGDVHFLVALGNAARLRGFGIGGTDVTELDWWEGVQVDVPLVGSVTMTCTPSQHFSGRGVLDHGSTLWCSWVVDAGASTNAPGTNHSSTSEKVFFAGDTGYRYLPKEAKESDMPSCPVFKEIGEAFGPFDLSLIPIGLFLPRPLMSSVHCSPEDALCLHKDLKSRKSIGMHYGTVRGGISQYFEEVTEPPRRFKEACEKDGRDWGEELGLLNIGQTLVVLN